MNSKIILIGGGSASGKSRLAKRIKKHFLDDALIISCDNYCIPHPELSIEERDKLNYDHPSAYDGKQLVEDLKKIMNDGSYSIPSYNFSTHLRNEERIPLESRKYIFIDGIFSLYYKELLDIAHFKIFCSASEEIRLTRRMNRDINERGRTKESVLSQFFTTVQPMHEKYIEPTISNADFVFESTLDDNLNDITINNIIKIIERFL